MPKRSATAPAKGWPMPQRRFCSAKASANTSRPQPFACDIGVRKRPKEERGPKPSKAMRQPQTMITVGVLHVRERAVWASWLMGAFQCCIAATAAEERYDRQGD